MSEQQKDELAELASKDTEMEMAVASPMPAGRVKFLKSRKSSHYSPLDYTAGNRPLPKPSLWRNV
jgi:hypothetical protein